MSWIKTIGYEEADLRLKKIYDRVKGPDNNIDNVLSIHSLRPHSLTGHMTLYKCVLHNSNNTLPKWYLEAIGVYVSKLNNCDYCVAHHSVGLKRLLKDEEKYTNFITSLDSGNFKECLNKQYATGMEYAYLLTMNLSKIQKETIDGLIKAGFTEGEVLEINQVASYFNYVNRMVVGLGVDTVGDIIGLSPNDSNDPTDWNHK